MGRKVAIPWHALFSVAAGVLYFFFVLPRWPELMGDTTHSLGTTLRIVTGVLLAMAALPVVFTLLRTRKPELGTPQLALSMRVSSIVAHVLGGVLILGTAISEIWLSLNSAGQWLFGIYGAAAAIGLLGIFAFYLSFVAEMPPPPPKPIKPKKPKQRRLRRKKGDADTSDAEEAKEGEDAEEAEEAADAEEAAEGEEAEETAPAEVSGTEGTEAQETEETEAPAEPEPADEPVEAKASAQTEETEETEKTEETRGGLQNRRPTGKGSHRMRRRRTSGVAVDE
jgi:hypothetical protein